MKTLKNALKQISIFVVLMILVIGCLMYYWHYTKLYPSTSDAYMSANVVQIKTQVSGPIIQLPISTNQFVKKGQLLAVIDPRPYEYSLMSAKANFQLSEQKVQALQQQVAVAKAQMQQAQITLNVAEKNVPRTLTLASQGGVSKAEGIKAQGQLDTAKANLKTAKSRYLEAVRNLGKPGELNAEVLQAKAQLQQAQLDLEHTHIYAPSDGVVTQLKIHPGSVVSAGEAQFALVETQQWWVNANFKETAMQRIHPGQTAQVRIDMYPGIKFNGRVASISPGSGASFSLLPPENASGNWVKVTQRFPVRVIVEAKPGYPFRIGMSCKVKINTKDSKKPA
ncbi:MAG: HlyD family secretion protein [Pseudomonadota bacterium]